MADVTHKAPASLQDEHLAATRAVENWLYANCSDVTPVSREEVQHIRRGLVGGWRVPLEVADGTRYIQILIPAAFPFRPPRIRLLETPDDVSWPHREREDVLCLVPETASFDPADPVGGVVNLLNMTIELSRKVAAGEANEEFRSEVLSYWTHRIPAERMPIYSIAEPQPNSRAVRVWTGSSSRVIAEDSGELDTWLGNRYPGIGPIKQDVGAIVWIDKALTPAEFPVTGNDVWQLAVRAGAGQLLAAAAAAVRGDLVVGLGMETVNGLAIAGLVVPRPPRRRGRDMVSDGFRPGRTPTWLAAKRFFGAAPVVRHDLKRVDHAWVHGRDHDSRASGLRSKTVVVVGCGSVGAPAAIALAQAGVGKFIFVDPDSLNPSNISRHPLGAQYLGQPKADALADKLKRDVPHLVVRPLVGRIEELLLTVGDLVSNVDLVVAATGDWGADVMLDAWHTSAGRTVPVVYGWTEAHACAGHAVAILSEGAAFRDGFDPTGLPALPVTEWKATTQLQEPACGAVYQPYGPIELQGTISVIAELALDALLGEVSVSTHRVWAGREKHLLQVDGAWSRQWLRETSGRTEGGFLLERRWAAPIAAKALAA